MNLSTKWLGMELANPFVPSASPLTRSLDAARQLEDAGAGALVMYSLFEESLSSGEYHAKPLQRPPGHPQFPGELDNYLEQVAALKAALDIPVVASLNGITASGWMRHAREIADAGADALELNTYYVAGDIWEEGHYVEQRYVTLLRELRSQVDIPINMKLSPFFSSIGNVIKKLEAVGVSGVSLFNRFYQPDIDIDGLRLQHTLTTTRSNDALLAMRWMAMLRGRVDCSLGATGGVFDATDAIKLLLAGSDVVHLCNALLQHGPQRLGEVIRDVGSWMERQGFETVADFRGRLSQSSVLDPTDYERLQYLQVLAEFRQEQGAWG